VSRTYEKMVGLIQVKQTKLQHQCEVENCFGENTTQHVRRLVSVHICVVVEIKLKWFKFSIERTD
jgi:hypothetical protein